MRLLVLLVLLCPFLMAQTAPPVFVQLKNFAFGDGRPDETAGVQAWLNACTGGTTVCWLDDGLYNVSAALAVNGANPTIRGAGKYRSVIKQTNCAADGMDVIPVSGRVTLEDFTILGCDSGATAGALLYVTNTSGHTMRNLALDYGFIGAWMDGCYEGVCGFGSFVMDDVDVSGCKSDCIYAVSTGDSKIVNSIINGKFQGAGSGVHEVGYCGLSIEHNKITYGAIGIWFDSPTDADCVARHNSIEGQYGDGIILTMGTSGAVGDVQIQDNQIGVYGRAIQIGSAMDTGGPQFTQVTGNMLNCASAPNAVGLAMYVSLSALIADNTVAGCYEGLYIGPYANHTRVGPMSFDPGSVTIPVANSGADTKFTPLQSASPY